MELTDLQLQDDAGQTVPREALFSYWAIGAGCLVIFIISICIFLLFGATFAAAMVNENTDLASQIFGTRFNSTLVTEGLDGSSAVANIQEISCGEVVSGTLLSDDVALWDFTGVALEFISASVQALDNSFEPIFELALAYGDHLSTIETSQSQINPSGNTTFEYTLPKDGEYQFSISASEGQGNYEFVLTCQSPLASRPLEVTTPTPQISATVQPEEPSTLLAQTPTELSDPTPIPGLGTGDLQITLLWSSTADLDLHVTDPTGDEISFEVTTSTSGGRLDQEANGFCELATTSPVENIYWKTGAAPSGLYTVGIYYFAPCLETGEQNFEVIVRVDGQFYETFSGSVSSSNPIQEFQFEYGS